MLDLPIGRGFFYRHLTIRRLVWAVALFHLIRAVSTVTTEAQGAQLNSLNAQAGELTAANTSLQVAVAQANSVAQLHNYATSHNLVAPTTVIWDRVR